MADLTQQRQSLEEARRRLTSQRAMRQIQDRNQTLQRQQQLSQIGQQEGAIRQQEEILAQQQQQQVSPESLKAQQKQRALAILLRTGKPSQELLSLSKKERAEIEGIAEELQASRERGAGIGAVAQAEKKLNVSLTPELRRDIYLRGASGQYTIELPNLSAKFEQLTKPQYTSYTPPIAQRPLVVSQAKTFTQQAKGIIFAPVEKTRSGAYNLPAQVRKIAPLTTLTVRTGAAKLEQGLKNFGIGADSPIFRESGIPYSVTGSLALGSLLVGISGTTAVGVSKYVKNGIVYEIDSAGNVISASKLSDVKAQVDDFYSALSESKAFYNAGNEATLRMKTRELIQKASANPKQLESLKKFYSKAGRSDLYNDILEQEVGQIARTNTISKGVIDKPVKLVGAGQITSTSQYAGTGQYERTDYVSSGTQAPKSQINQMLGLQQTGLQFNNLAIRQEPKALAISGIISKTKQAQQNILGLRSEVGQRSPQGQGSLPKILQLFRTQQAQRSQQRLAQRTQLQFGKPRSQRPERTRPRGRLPFGFKIPSKSTSLTKVGTEDNFGVGIEVRRGGRFTLIGKESSLGKAVMKASGFVDVNLARSFRLRELSTGQLLDIANLPVGFRRAKREAKTFVELPSRSLSQFGEKKEIQYFKKSKSRRRLL